jgi:hypothetical protein
VIEVMEELLGHNIDHLQAAWRQGEATKAEVTAGDLGRSDY